MSITGYEVAAPQSCVAREPNYTQVCVWEGCLVPPEQLEQFKQFMLDELHARVQFLETIPTLPDVENGRAVEGTGGRHDVFFAVHKEDVNKFAVPRLSYGIRWVEDVMNPQNHSWMLYPKRVNEYLSWDPTIPGMDD